MNPIAVFLDELLTPSGQVGPAARAYQRAVVGIAHAMLGAAVAAWLGYGLGLAAALGLAYWAAKESGDLRRGGGVWDGIEDALMVSLGAWYGTVWWPAVILAAGAGLGMSSIMRGRHG